MARKDFLFKMRDVLHGRRHALLKMLAVPDVEGLPEVLPDEITAMLAEADCRELENIAGALTRMHAGTYGVCDYCGGEISLARLNAVPYTVSCLECQQHCDREALHLDAATVVPEASKPPTAAPLLIVTRRKNESLVINEEITIFVVAIRGDTVRLGIEFPHGVSVQRGEVYAALLRDGAET